jgi:hypothetical protein
LTASKLYSDTEAFVEAKFVSHSYGSLEFPDLSFNTAITILAVAILPAVSLWPFHTIEMEHNPAYSTLVNSYL